MVWSASWTHQDSREGNRNYHGSTNMISHFHIILVLSPSFLILYNKIAFHLFLGQYCIYFHQIGFFQLRLLGFVFPSLYLIECSHYSCGTSGNRPAPNAAQLLLRPGGLLARTRRQQAGEMELECTPTQPCLRICYWYVVVICMHVYVQWKDARYIYVHTACLDSKHV